MDLSDDLKSSLIPSNNTNIINDQTYRNLLECSFCELIRDQNGPGKSTENEAKQFTPYPFQLSIRFKTLSRI